MFRLLVSETKCKRSARLMVPGLRFTILSDVAAADVHGRSDHALHHALRGLLSAQITADLAAVTRSAGFIEDHNTAISTAKSVQWRICRNTGETGELPQHQPDRETVSPQWHRLAVKIFYFLLPPTKEETVYLILNLPTLLWVVLKAGSLSLLGAFIFCEKVPPTSKL
jgi:hypothetical protein